MSHELLRKHWVHFLATDAHNTGSRPPCMRDSHDLVASKYGASYAHALCVTNPLAVFLGKQFTVEQEPEDIYDDPKIPTLWERVKELLARR